MSQATPKFVPARAADPLARESARAGRGNVVGATAFLPNAAVIYGAQAFGGASNIVPAIDTRR